MKQIKYLVHAFLILIALFFVIDFFYQIISSENKTIITENIDSERQLNLNSKGKTLFNQNCASCHSINRNVIGPALANFEERGPWSDRKKLYAWIYNPAAFMKNDSYTQVLKQNFGTLMQGFPGLSERDIDEIILYINESSNAAPVQRIAMNY